MKNNSSYSVIDETGEVSRRQVKVQEKKRDSSFKDLDAMNIGYYLVTPILMGVILGLTVDDRLNTKPVFTVALILLGMFASMYNMLKLVNKNAKNQH